MKAPFLVKLPWSIINTPALCVDELEPIGHRVIYDSTAGGIRTVTYRWGSIHSEPGANANPAKGDTGPAIKRFKELCLSHNATPEAIWCIHGISPFTRKELSAMAEKLKTKAAAKPAAKAPAKTKPVADGGKLAETKPASKRKGNAAALEKARAAKGAATRSNDTQKITVKTKENPYREGTKAAATFDLLKKSKTVGDFKAAATDDHDIGYLRYASRDGHISLG